MNFDPSLNWLPLKVVGVGVTAFNRIMPAFFLPDYQIICYKNSQELSLLRKKCPVLSLEENGQKIGKLNSYAILAHPLVQKHLKSLGQNLGIFVYKSSARLQGLCRQNGWQLIANPPGIRDPYEDKRIFRGVLEKIGLKPIPGEILSLAGFSESLLVRMQAKYGPQLVLKLPEVKQGGGRGNTFVEKKEDLKIFWSKVKELARIYDLKHLLVEKKIEGISPSITGCVTRRGVLTGVVQTQITDIPEVVAVQNGSGMFVGHDWSYAAYPEKVRNQARQIARKFGEYLGQQGYRGVFGLDFIVERQTEEVYPCECNPRYTGAFPVYSLIQLKQKEPPFDLFHFREHLGFTYHFDFTQTQHYYWRPKNGAHLILSNKTPNWLKVTGRIRAGVYRLMADQLKFIRLGFSPLDLQDPDEFVLTDGVPFSGALIKPYLRILKLIFPNQILTKDGQNLDWRTRQIVSLVYHQLALKPVKVSEKR
jgi:hypothetical protein